MILVVGCTDSTSPTESGAGVGGESGGSSEGSDSSEGSSDSSSSSDNSSTSTKSTTKTTKKATKKGGTTKKKTTKTTPKVGGKTPTPPPPPPKVVVLTDTQKMEAATKGTMTDLKALFGNLKGSKDIDLTGSRAEDYKGLKKDIEDGNLNAFIDKILSIKDTDADRIRKLKRDGNGGRLLVTYLEFAIEEGEWQMARILIAAGDDSNEMGWVQRKGQPDVYRPGSILDHIIFPEYGFDDVVWWVAQLENIPNGINYAGDDDTTDLDTTEHHLLAIMINRRGNDLANLAFDLIEKIDAIDANLKNSAGDTVLDYMLKQQDNLRVNPRRKFLETDPRVKKFIDDYGAKKAADL